jgi:hypothetical protein
MGRLSGRPFCLRPVIAVTALREALCLTIEIRPGWGPGVSEMSYHQRPQPIVLGDSR